MVIGQVLNAVQHFLANLGSYGLQVFFVIIGGASCYYYYRMNREGERIGR